MLNQGYLSTLFAPKNIAVIGASEKSGKIGNIILSNLQTAGYTGSIFPVNPKGGTILGLKVLCKIDDLPADQQPLDLAVICVPAPKVAEAIKDLALVKTSSAIIISAGFKEIGGIGLTMETEIKALAEKYNIRLLGPNCLGIINTRSKINTTFAVADPRVGNIGFFSQSGALCVSLLDWAKTEKIGFSSFVSLGNKVDLDESDILAQMTQDPDTKVIVGYLESVEHGQRFLQQAQISTRQKPVILLRSGSTAAGSKAASSHTGALAGTDMAYDAAFRQSGIIRAKYMEELFQLAQAFARQPFPKGPGVTIITNAGGPGIVAADACEKMDLSLTNLSSDTILALKELLPPFAALHNPVDVVGDAHEDIIPRTVEIIQKDPNLQSLLILVAPTAIAPVDGIARKLIPILKKQTEKPVFCCFMGGGKAETAHELLTDAGYPCYHFPEPAVNAIAAMYRYSQWKHTPMPVEISYRRDLPKARSVIAEAKASSTLELVEFQAQELLKAYEMPLLKAKLARTSEEAVQIAKQFGQPVALKIASPQISHKTDVNGVVLGLESSASIKNAFTEITSRAKRLRRDAYIAGCLVQAMAPKGAREVIVGFKRDQRFGPMVIFGLGGIHVEVFKDIASRITPLSLDDVTSMIREIRAYPILAGMRGEKSVDFKALEDILLIMSQLAQDFPEIQEAECNPVLLSEHGAVVADIRVILSK